MKKRKKRKSIGQQSMKRAQLKGVAKESRLVEDPVQRTMVQSQPHGEPVESGDEAQSLQELAGAADTETAGSGTDSSTIEPPNKTRKRKRKSIGQQSKKRGDAKVSVKRRKAALPDASPHPVEFKIESPQITPGGSGMVTFSTESAPQEQDSSQVEGLPKQAKSKRKKRKSIGQQKPRRASNDAVTLKKTTKRILDGGQATKTPKARTGAGAAASRVNESLRKPPTPSDDGEQDDILAESAPENDSPAIVNTKRQRGRPPKAGGKVSTKTPSTKVQRPPKQNPTQSQLSQPKPRKPPTNSIPITLYRPSPSASASDSDSDPLTAPIPPAPKTIAATDVLAQITRELIFKSTASLSASDRNPKFKRRKHTTDLYAAELESRLRQLGRTLNTSTVLAARVRKMALEEKRVKKMVKEVEKERAELKERKEEALNLKKRQDLEKLLEGIAGAVETGWAMGGDA